MINSEVFINAMKSHEPELEKVISLIHQQIKGKIVQFHMVSPDRTESELDHAYYLATIAAISGYLIGSIPDYESLEKMICRIHSEGMVLGETMSNQRVLC